MKKIILSGILSVIAINPVIASEKFATKEEAQTMVKQVHSALKTAKEQTIKEIIDKDAKWNKADLYPVVYDKEGTALAHGQNPKQVGKNLILLKDSDGKEFIKERLEMAKTQKSFWQDYKFKDPVTSKVLNKEAYCEVEDLIVCAGVYKR